jgi:serine/threonine-protein phosphatase 2B catalytic subunit
MASAVPTNKPPAVKNWREERVMKDVPAPVWEPLEKSKVWDKDNMPNLANLKEHFKKEGLLNMEDAMQIIQRATALYKKEPNLLHVNDPITVCGDIHGQYYDLIKLFEIGGNPADTQYLFLGDYVDRGCFSCECAMYLLCHKIHYPKTFLMLRGNHECRHLTAYFNFKQECKYKYNMQVYDALMNCFDCLPLAAILNGRFLCVHGGLSPDVQTVQDIVNINRFREPPPSGPMTDLIWSDPMDEEEEEASPDALYLHNDLRGCSYVFSFNAVCQFLKNNNLLSVIRAHEAQDEGYRLYKKNASTGFPTVICIFSAPNYCDAYNNKAAIIRFQNNLMNIRQFNSSPHPYYLPNFMNAFSWSLPFVAEKVTDMLLTIWHLVDDEAEEARHEEGREGVLQERGDKIRNKILAMGKVARIYKTLREENENILQLKGLAGGKVPVGILQQGAGAIQQAVTNFEGAKKCDALNEKRPAFAGGA